MMNEAAVVGSIVVDASLKPTSIKSEATLIHPRCKDGMQIDSIVAPDKASDVLRLHLTARNNYSSNESAVNLPANETSVVTADVVRLSTRKEYTGTKQFNVNQLSPKHSGIQQEYVRYSSPPKVTNPSSALREAKEDSHRRNRLFSLGQPTSCLRTKSFELNRPRVSCDQVNRALSWNERTAVEECPKQLPEVIVFINDSVQRQKRRSSMCSQITVDTDRSNNFDVDNDVDEDVSNRSLDVQDIFSEGKFIGYKKPKEASVSSGNDETSSSNSCFGCSIQKLRKDSLQNGSDERKRSGRAYQIQYKLQKSVNNLLCKKGNNSARIRWIRPKDDFAVQGSDSCDDELTESEYEDFAQDSLRQVYQGDIVRHVTCLTMTDDSNDSTKLEDDGRGYGSAEKMPKVTSVGPKLNPPTTFSFIGRAA